MAMDNRVVVRFRNGRILKGFTHDFGPQKNSFHVIEEITGERTKVVNTGELKAVFFVKSFDGDPQRDESPDLAALHRTPGVKVKVTFSDGEVVWGTSAVYSRRSQGFFVRPADPGSNNDRLFVLATSTARVETWI